MVFFKTIVAYSLPVLLCLSVLFVGLVLLWFKRAEKVAKIIVSSGCFLSAAFSFPFLPNMLLGHLEQEYPTIVIPPNGWNRTYHIRYVVILAGGHVSDTRIPITGQFSYEGLVRLIEGLRFYKKCAGTKLILSGGKGRHTNVSDAELMRDLAMELGVKEEAMILETESESTYDEAKILKSILGDERFFLVTSASHMPRAMLLFRNLGMNPVAAPTGHLVKRYGDRSYMPSVDNLRKSEAAFYEILATVKMKLFKNWEKRQ